MHPWCIAGANEGEEAAARWVADVAKLSVGREDYYLRELATDHEQHLSGHGESRAGRTELEGLADRLLAERAVSVVADRAVEERRWSTPGLLAVEQQLVESATGRTAEQTSRISHQAVREALAAHPTTGPDQEAMVRDLCQGGHGVAVVVDGPGPARPSPSASPAMPGSWTATGSWPQPRPASPP
jgi:hypothetical protein